MDVSKIAVTATGFTVKDQHLVNPLMGALKPQTNGP